MCTCSNYPTDYGIVNSQAKSSFKIKTIRKKRKKEKKKEKNKTFNLTKAQARRSWSSQTIGQPYDHDGYIVIQGQRSWLLL